MNRVLLVGNIGATPVIRETDEKSRYAVFYLATDDKWFDAKGVPQTRTDWHRVVVFRDKLVDFIGKFLKKGARVIVEGKLQNRKFVGDDGTEGSITEVLVSKKGPGFVTWLHSPLAPVVSKSQEAEKNSADFAGNVNEARYE
ncbi:MAG: single-stranded DNA-binding protein [Pseudomonadota bacterium]